MSFDDQPDVVFGGRRLNDYIATWPPAFYRGLPIQTLPDYPFTPINTDWSLRQVGDGGCCAGAWWKDSDRLYFIDGIEGQIASVFEFWLDGQQPPTIVQNAPPAIISADGAFQLIYEPEQTTIRRLDNGAEWTLGIPNNFPVLSPDNRLLMYSRGEADAMREIWVTALDGSVNRVIWSSEGRNATARWLDSEHVLISERELIPGRYTTLTVVQIEDSTTYSLGTWYGLRNIQIAPGGNRLIFASTFNPDPANDGTFALEIEPGAVPQKLPWFGDYRWRDAESVFYITFDPTTDIQQLNSYHVLRGEAEALTDPDTMPFTIANGDWSVSPDGRAIVFQEARDHNIWLLAAVEQP